MGNRVVTILVAVMVIAATFVGCVPGDQTADAPQWEDTRHTLIDTDGSDGYSGDYVVIYNTDTTDAAVTTGNLDGLIETELEPEEHFPVTYEVTGSMESEPYSAEPPKAPEDIPPSKYQVGDTPCFVIEDYQAGIPLIVDFETLAVGKYCYIWTPVSDKFPAPFVMEDTHPLDGTDPDYAQSVANEFDSQYPLLEEAFGGFYDPEGECRINILFYNIRCQWQTGPTGYIAGFYHSLYYDLNNAAIINIDTYPTIRSEDGSIKDISVVYGTIVHEMQHLINHNVSFEAELWLNELKSAAAGEMFYPGSSLHRRISQWHGYRTQIPLHDADGNITGLYSGAEYPAVSGPHNGDYIYQMETGVDGADTFYYYAQTAMLAQYLYTQAGTNTIFRKMSEAVANGTSSIDAIAAGMEGTPLEGMTTSEIIGNFRVALVANDSVGHGGKYGFNHQEGYDPASNYNMDSLFEMLAPCVFTGSKGSIQGGGAIVVKPVDGVFNPPADASPMLQYTGVSIRYAADESEPVKTRVKYTLTDASAIDPSKRYIIATKVGEEYYALSAQITEQMPFAPKGKALTVTGNGVVNGADCGFHLLEWAFTESEGGGYTIAIANTPEYRLVTTARAAIGLDTPSLDCIWRFENGGMTQTKFVEFPSLVYNIENGIFIPTNAEGIEDDAEFSTDIYLFEKP